MGGKEEKETEEEYQASFTPKIKFREGTWYLWGKPGHTLPDLPKHHLLQKINGHSKS